VKFSQETSDGSHTITAHSKTSVSVDTIVYDSSLILLPDEIIEDWPVNSFSEVSTENLMLLRDKSIEIVLLGTGAKHRIAQPVLMSYFVQQNIGCEAMSTAAACRTYNLLINEGRRVAACLLLENH